MNDFVPKTTSFDDINIDQIELDELKQSKNQTTSATPHVDADNIPISSSCELASDGTRVVFFNEKQEKLHAAISSIQRKLNGSAWAADTDFVVWEIVYFDKPPQHSQLTITHDDIQLVRRLSATVGPGCDGGWITEENGQQRFIGMAAWLERYDQKLIGARNTGLVVREPIKFMCTDYGNAERMVHQHRKNMRYVSESGNWLIWNDKRWVTESDGEIERFAKATVRSMYDDISALAILVATTLNPSMQDKYKERMEALAKHARFSESKRALDAMIELSKSESGVTVSPSVLDGDLMKFNVLNGTVDLRTGKLHPHERNDLLTKIVKVEFKGLTERCPIWNKSILAIMSGDREMVSYLQRCIGYALTGLTTEQCLFVMYGGGSNGKSTFLEVIRLILEDYSQQAEFTTFLERKGEGPRPDIARMAGVRFMSATEGPEGKHLDEALIKSITGGDKLTARFLYKGFFEFTPTHKIFLGTNHLLVIKGADNGIWRRMRLIPFDASFEGVKKDDNLLEKLRKELPGILAWAIRGCLHWQYKGLGIPAKVKKATDGYRSEMDVVLNFVEQSCVVAPNVEMKSSKIYEFYKEWCDSVGNKPFSQKRFSQRLESKGYKKENRNDGVYWIGIKARANDLNFGI